MGWLPVTCAFVALDSLCFERMNMAQDEASPRRHSHDLPAVVPLPPGPIRRSPSLPIAQSDVDFPLLCQHLCAAGREPRKFLLAHPHIPHCLEKPPGAAEKLLMNTEIKFLVCSPMEKAGKELPVLHHPGLLPTVGEVEINTVEFPFSR